MCDFVLGAAFDQILRQPIAWRQIGALRRHLFLSRHRIQRSVYVRTNEEDGRSEHVSETHTRFGRMEH